MKLFLGSYRVGQTYGPKIATLTSPVAAGPFKGQHVSIPDFSSSGPGHVPPLSRHYDSGLDFTPFLLADQVLVDSRAFETLMTNTEPVKGLRIAPSVRQVFEGLAKNGIVQLVDTGPILADKETQDELQKMLLSDLSDQSILEPMLESLRLWIQFRQEAMERGSKDRQRFESYIDAVLRERFDDPRLFRVLLHSILDVNLTIVASARLGASVFDWEDYVPYYRHRCSQSTIERRGVRRATQRLRNLIDLFVPHFEIRSFNQLRDLRQHPGLSSLRRLVSSETEIPDNRELVNSVRLDVLELKEEVAGYVRLFGWVTDVFNVVPFLGGYSKKFADKLVERERTNAVLEQHGWKFFCVDMRKNYSKSQIESQAQDLATAG